MRVRFLYTQDGQIRSFDETINAGVFRNFIANNVGVGTTLPVGGYHVFSIVDGRANRTLVVSVLARASSYGPWFCRHREMWRGFTLIPRIIQQLQSPRCEV